MIVLPIEGYGLWSTLYGFLALEADTEDDHAGLTYYEHGETAGLGGEVDNPKLEGVVARTASPLTRTVRRGDRGDQGDGGAAVRGSHHQSTASPGATITGRGVTNMLHFLARREAASARIWRSSERAEVHRRSVPRRVSSETTVEDFHGRPG